MTFLVWYMGEMSKEFDKKPIDYLLNPNYFRFFWMMLVCIMVIVYIKLRMDYDVRRAN